MQNDIFVFTEIIGCAHVGKVAIESFHKHHDQTIFIFATDADMVALGAIRYHHNNRFIIVDHDKTLLQLYKSGHRGTAYIFAKVFSGEMYPEYQKIVHIDSDIFFKSECLSIIIKKFEEGYDIVGSRRCYINNPGGIKVPDNIPDAVSTYFYGMQRRFIPKGYSFDQLVDMFQGHNTGLDHMVFDFADCITFHALKLGAEIYFVDSNLIGGQDENGSKVNDYYSNLYLDAGSCLIHFGGAGSGCAYVNDPDGKNEDYGKWALIRYALHCSLFSSLPLQLYGRNCGVTGFDENNRWVSGDYNGYIFDTIRRDMMVNTNHSTDSNLDAAVKKYSQAMALQDYNHNTVIKICKEYSVNEMELKATYKMENN